MAFDVEGARKAGYTDAEIAAHLAQAQGYDLAGAKKSGYSDSEVIAHLSKAPTSAVNQIPGQAPGVKAPAATAAPVSTEPTTIADKAIGAGEAALTTITGATGGTLGMLGGTLKGLAEEILSGKFGTPEANGIVERSMQQGAEALTYAPRTPSGQAQAEAVGNVMQQLAPVAGLMPQMQMVAAGTQPATQAMSVAMRAGAAGAADAVLGARPAARAAAVKAPQPTPVQQVLPATTQQLTQTARSAGQGSSKAADILATQAAPDPVVVKSAERLGVQDYLQPDHVTTNEAYRQVVGAIKSNPQSSVALAEREGLAAVAKRANDLIDEIGGTNDLSALDATIKSRMKGTHAELMSREDALYDQMRAQIDPRAEAPATRVLAFIEERAKNLDGKQNLTPLERSILTRLSPKSKTVTETVPGNPLMPGSMTETRRVVQQAKQPTYTLLDDVRKDVGAASRMQGAFADADTGLAKKLYSLILDDQEQAVGAAGLRGVFDEARQLTTLRKGLEDDLTALFGKDLDRTFVAGGDRGLPGAVRGLAGGDSARLTRLLSAVPQEMRQQVVASGLSTVFRKAATRGEMDFTGYAKWWAGLQRNRQAYSALMSNLPLESRKQLTALARVSQGISDSLAARTKTGALNTIKQEMMSADGLMESLYSVAKRAAVAIPSEAASTAVGLPGAGLSAAFASALTKGKPKAMAGVDNLIASPEFAQLVKAKAGTPQQTAAVKKTARSRDFARLLRAVNVEMSLSERELFIVQAMQFDALDEAQRKQAPGKKKPTVREPSARRDGETVH